MFSPHSEMPLSERVEDHSAVPVENGAAVTLEYLRTHYCRWPLGAVEAKPPFLYCGERALTGKPYCDEHCARAFQARKGSGLGDRRSSFSHSESGEHPAKRRRFLATLINAGPPVQSVPPMVEIKV